MIQKKYIFTLLKLSDTLKKISNSASFPQNQNVYCNDMAEFAEIFVCIRFLELSSFSSFSLEF